MNALNLNTLLQILQIFSNLSNTSANRNISICALRYQNQKVLVNDTRHVKIDSQKFCAKLNQYLRQK